MCYGTVTSTYAVRGEGSTPGKELLPVKVRKYVPLPALLRVTVIVPIRPLDGVELQSTCGAGSAAYAAVRPDGIPVIVTEGCTSYVLNSYTGTLMVFSLVEENVARRCTPGVGPKSHDTGVGAGTTNPICWSAVFPVSDCTPWRDMVAVSDPQLLAAPEAPTVVLVVYWRAAAEIAISAVGSNTGKGTTLRLI